MKIVVNRCHGGFCLSEKGLERLIKLGSKEAKQYIEEIKGYTSFKNCHSPPVERTDPLLIKVIEELGKKADGQFARLEIVEIPDDVEWKIEEYDGSEWIAEKHRTW